MSAATMAAPRRQLRPEAPPVSSPAARRVARSWPTPARAAAAARLAGADEASAAAAAAASRVVAIAPAREPEPDPAPQPQLRVVERPKLSATQRRRRARALLLGGAGLVVAIAFGLVYLHVAMAQRQFTLDQLDSQVQQQQLAYQKLRLKVAQLGSPQHVISIAVGRLGMQQPASVTYLAPSTTIGQPLPPPRASSRSGGPSNSATTVPAPAGDASWPQIKSLLAGTP